MSDKTVGENGIISCLWEKTARPGPSLSRLDGLARVDIAVVGGGFTGLSTALHLAEKQVSVAVLEAGELGAGASGRNGGQVNAGIKLDPPEAEARYGKEIAGKILDLSGSAPDYLFDLVRRHDIECDARQSGWVLPALSNTVLEKYERKSRAWNERGVPTRLLDAKQTAGLLGSDAYVGAFLDPRCGAVQPLSYVRGLAAAAIRQGARINIHSRVNSIFREGTLWRLKTATGEVIADKVVIATDAYSDDLWPGLRKTILATNSFQIATDPLSEDVASRILPANNTVTDSRRILYYYRKDQDNRFVIGGRGQFGDPSSLSDFRHLYKAARTIFPVLKDVRIAHHWGGKVSMTIDETLHVHEPERGLTVVIGYNGRGVALATAIGKVLSGHLLGDRDAMPFPIVPIRPIPLHQFQRLYIAAGMAWFSIADMLGR